MRSLALLLILMLAAAGCADGPAASPAEASEDRAQRALAPAGPTTSTTTPSPTTPTTTVTPTTTATTAATATASPTTTTITASPTTTTITIPEPTTVPPTTTQPFASSLRTVTAADLGASWREGCPVEVADLRALTVRHWAPGGTVADGVLIVHRDHTAALATVFEAIFAAQFEIASMRPVSEFGADDDRSMAANNSSAFNCREISGQPGVWSQHSYGGAVDINPVVNPWVRGSTVDPPAGAAYLDRTAAAAGLIRDGDAVTAAFASIGWGWGGSWTSTIDYQHFSANGR